MRFLFKICMNVYRCYKDFVIVYNLFYVYIFNKDWECYGGGSM